MQEETLLKLLLINERMRYSRQELFQEIGKEGQQILSKKHAVIVGVGALGTVAAELLVRAGVGKVTLLDRDCVALHNLQRQSLFTEEDVGKAKASCAAAHLRSINKDVVVEEQVVDLDYTNIELLQGDVVVDGTDNLVTRFLINEYCVKNKLPWVYGSGIRAEGYVKSYLPGKDCFACTFTEASGLESCDTAGVLNVTTHVIASLQVSEVLKILLEKEVEGKLLHLNVWKQVMEKIETKKNPSCRVCKGTYDYLQGKHAQELIKFCGSDQYQIKGKAIAFTTLREKLSPLGKVEDDGICLRFKALLIFKDGRVLVQAKSVEEAKSLYSKYLGH